MGLTALEKYRTNVKKFKNLDIEKMGLESGEQIAHCIDSKSFEGKFYYPQWVVTDRGRVWSMKYNKWLIPQILNGYWGLAPKENGKTKSVYIHLLVCNYFRTESDQIALEWFGEQNIHGHHIRAIHIPNRLKGKGYDKEKMKMCMKDSCKDNIVYQEITADHINDTSMANGGITIEEKAGTAVWSDDLQAIRNSMQKGAEIKGNSFGTYYIYSKDEQGKFKKEIRSRYNCKGVLSKNDIALGKYKVNAGEYNDFVFEHKEEILKRIEQEPPKSHDYTKGFILDNTSILYALN